MKKRQHKIGTTILLALAPACALGVTLGVVASLKNNKQDECSEDKWWEKFDQMLSVYLNTFNTYGQKDITFKIDGVSQTDIDFTTFSPLGGYEGGKMSDIVCFNIPESISLDGRIKVAGEGLKKDIKELITTAKVVKYFMTDTTLKVKITQSDNTSHEFEINNYGYVTKEIVVQTSGTTTFDIEYANTPRLITEYEMKYRFGTFLYKCALAKNTLYTASFTFDPTIQTDVLPISINVQKYDVNLGYIGVEITDYSIEPATINWSYQGSGTFKGDPLTQKTTVTIKFKVPEDLISCRLTAYCQFK